MIDNNMLNVILNELNSKKNIQMLDINFEGLDEINN